MANIKRLEQLTGWLEYELETTLLDPPTLRVRLRPIDTFDLGDVLDGATIKPTATLGLAIRAVADWELTQDGQPLLMTEDIKAAVLRPLMSEKVKDRTILGIAIIQDAQNRELFLKN